MSKRIYQIDLEKCSLYFLRSVYAYISIHTVNTQLKNDDLVIYKSFNLLVHKLVTVDHSKKV